MKLQITMDKYILLFSISWTEQLLSPMYLLLKYAELGLFLQKLIKNHLLFTILTDTKAPLASNQSEL